MACATLKRSLDWEPPLNVRPAKRRRCIPFFDKASPPGSPPAAPMNCGPSTSAAGCSGMMMAAAPRASVFPEVVGHKLTSEHMAESIKAELKRLHRRRQLQFSAEPTDGGHFGGDNSNDASSRALFTFKQVGMICERMLREFESGIRAEYDNVLSTKLAEQYEDFVRFTVDQVERNYGGRAQPSYLS